MKTVGLFIAGLMGFGAAANADGLAGLDAHLNGTGRIGVLRHGARIKSQQDHRATFGPARGSRSRGALGDAGGAPGPDRGAG